MKQKIKNLLFYASANVKPSEKNLLSILDKLPVTEYKEGRYTSVMGMKLAFPLGVIAVMIAIFLVFGKKTTTPSQNIITLPAKVTKENVDSSLNQVDGSIQNSMNEMDKDLQEMDQEDNSNSNDDLNDL